MTAASIPRRTLWAKETQPTQLRLIADDLDEHDGDIASLAAEVKRLRISINLFTGTIAASAIGVCATIVLAVT